MSMRSAVKNKVRPVVGERGWRALRAGKRRITESPAVRAAVQRRRLAAMSGDLRQLAVAFKTDKWGTHRYAQHYQRHLQRSEERRVGKEC